MNKKVIGVSLGFSYIFGCLDYSRYNNEVKNIHSFQITKNNVNELIEKNRVDNFFSFFKIKDPKECLNNDNLKLLLIQNKKKELFMNVFNTTVTTMFIPVVFIPYYSTWHFFNFYGEDNFFR